MSTILENLYCVGTGIQTLNSLALPEVQGCVPISVSGQKLMVMRPSKGSSEVNLALSEISWMRCNCEDCQHKKFNVIQNSYRNHNIRERKPRHSDWKDARTKITGEGSRAALSHSKDFISMSHSPYSNSTARSITASTVLMNRLVKEASQ